MQFLVEKSAYAIPRQVVSFHESVIHSGSTDPPVLLRHRPLANKSWAKPSAFVSFLGKYYAYSSISLHLRHRRLFLVQQPFRYPLASSFFLLSNAYFVQTSSPPDRNFVSYANVEKQMLFTSQRHRGRGEEREGGIDVLILPPLGDSPFRRKPYDHLRLEFLLSQSNSYLTRAGLLCYARIMGCEERDGKGDAWSQKSKKKKRRETCEFRWRNK